MLRAAFKEKLKEAMHAQDKIGVATIRLIMAALKDRDIAARGKGNADGITDDEILLMMQTMIKQRRESIEMYTKGGRMELAEREGAEIKIIDGFLPQQLAGDEMEAAIDGKIAEIKASGLKDMGKIMAELKDSYAGQMDFGKASGIVKEKLAAL